ncbi:hypothetical protein EWM64_g7346 [Hericium alpestre]|uniref:DUF202 domain-containing protein n=1 Tax=Hericium alpestre TaxID=135208 RepID=A0A4Y9ZRJ6_9AGAM|nr:hypothetical protein EWM64_g7346 [Hericium alpestre]
MPERPRTARRSCSSSPPSHLISRSAPRAAVRRTDSSAAPTGSRFEQAPALAPLLSEPQRPVALLAIVAHHGEHHQFSMSAQNGSTDGVGHAAEQSEYSSTGHPLYASESLIRRSWHAMSELLSPFSHTALENLPRTSRPARYARADAIPDAERDEHGEMPTVRDYHAINSVGENVQVRVPKKIKTPVRVEGKVWFANERTWISYLNMSILIGALAVALFNASKDDVARNFAYLYAVVSVGILIYGYFVYQYRITMIRRRDPGHFGMSFHSISVIR